MQFQHKIVACTEQAYSNADRAPGATNWLQPFFTTTFIYGTPHSQCYIFAKAFKMALMRCERDPLNAVILILVQVALLLVGVRIFKFAGYI